MLPEWVYWIVIVVLIIVIGATICKLNVLDKNTNVLPNSIDRQSRKIDKLISESIKLKNENKQLKLYVYQNISDYYKRNPDKKN